MLESILRALTPILPYIPPIAALVAAAGFILSCAALYTTASVARAQLYLELRKRFTEINNLLPRNPPGPKDYHDKTWHPQPDKEEDKKAFSIMERYWYHAFDEWFTTTIIHRWPFRRLWKAFFKRAIFEGLKNVPIRYVLYRMIKDPRTSFSGRSKQFEDDLAALYRHYRREEDPPTIFHGFDKPTPAVGVAAEKS